MVSYMQAKNKKKEKKTLFSMVYMKKIQGFIRD